MSISPSRWFPWGLLLAVCLGGCAETTMTYTPLNYAPLNQPPHPLNPRAPEQIQIFSSGAPERPHVDVGLLSVQEGAGGLETQASLIEALRQSAAARGCDALMLMPPRTTPRPTDLPGPFDTVYQVYSATCIVYTTTEPGDATATFAPPPSPPGSRRMCVSWEDFDQNRNCVLGATPH
jgi:hypothetical protein